ncbi:MAG: rod shape-determining protein MreD [Pacificimonas sp.]
MKRRAHSGQFGAAPVQPWTQMSARDRGLAAIRRLSPLIPFAIIVMGLILSAAPVFTPVAGWPNFGLVVLFLFALYRPYQLPVWMAVPLGICADIVFAMPLGVNAVLMPLFMLAVIWVDRKTTRIHWLADWAVAVPFVLMYQMILWRLCLIAGVSPPETTPLLPFLTQGAATLAAFPLVATLFVRVQRRFVDRDTT